MSNKEIKRRLGVERDQGNLPLWLLLSVFLHMTLGGWMVRHPIEKRNIFRQVYEVQLLPVREEAAAKLPDAAPPVPEPAPVKKEEPAPRKEAKKEKGKSRTRPKAGSRPEVAESAKAEDAIKRIRSRVDAETAIERIRKKVDQRERSGSGTGNGVRIVSSAPKRIYKYEELDAELRAYFQKISVIIRDAWVLPPSLIDKGPMVLAINIDRAGNIDSLFVESGSGNRFYDESVIRAINKVNPLPPLPSGWKGRFIDLGLRF